MSEFWRMSKEEVLANLNAKEEGLTSSEVTNRKEKYGENVIKEEEKKSVFRIFLEQFADLLVIILLVAAAISAMSGNVESTVVIIVVLIMNAILGTVEYVKAEKSLDSLKQLSSPVVKVKRDGKKIEIKSSEVTIGDIVLLEAGDVVAADGRVMESASLKVNESSLTGEVLEVEKTTEAIDENLALGDRKNMVHSGSLVVYGRGEMVVTAIGMDTELGKIAGMMNLVKEKRTPLQKNLDSFSKGLAVAIMIISAIVFGLYMYRNTPMIDSLMFAVALAVAAIPEALGSIVTIVQAIGTSKMAKENAIIKDLKAVESLGCVSVICSDKTGTLTQNKMSVQSLFVNQAFKNPEEIDLDDETERYLLYDAVLVNDAMESDGKFIGDPTEYALLEMANRVIDSGVVREQVSRTGELPFDSDRKMMSIRCSVHSVETMFTKGAPDILLRKCVAIRNGDTVVPMSDEERKRVVQAYEEYSSQGLRVLAFGYKETTKEITIDDEKELIFIGLIAMSDPLREETKQAVADAKSAGIRTVMITGDHKTTAVAIAREAGIFVEGDMAITGLELDEKSDEWLDAHIDKISVYARVSPENKIRIVESWQRRGYITAMTGDGVNDAPALKSANVGVAMGITGTEVSKDAASMILADDNFSTIIKAIANGRNVFRNIKNAILFLLSGNMAAIITVLYTVILGLATPFTAVHLLFMNLLTDSLPAIAIGLEPADASLLKVPPRDHKEGILTKDFTAKIFLQGGLIAVATIISYHIGLGESEAFASTMAFFTLTIGRLFHSFNCRNKASITKIKILSNKYSLLAFVAGILFILIVTFVPYLRTLFDIANIGMTFGVFAVLLAFIPTLCIQAYKGIRESRE